jgi:PIN domain nuclease of toxin-antitoxin system
MKYLLDTHILLWWFTRPKALPPALLNLLEDRAQKLLVSVAAPWELAIKTNTGKLDAGKILRELATGQLRFELEMVPAELSHVIRAGMLPLHHRDPFDRLMVAQALELGIPIISRDAVFDLYGVKRVWD